MLKFSLFFFTFFLWSFSLFATSGGVSLSMERGPASVQESQDEVISVAMARVGPVLLTSRHVILSQIVDSFLRLETKVKIVRPDQPQFFDKLTELVLDQIAFLEAQSFAIGDESPESQRQAEVIFEAMGASPDLRKYAFTKNEVVQMVMQKQRARKFLEIKSQDLGSNVSEERAREYFETHRTKFQGATFPSIKENIKAYLRKSQQEEQLQDWFEVLKKKYSLRYLTGQPLAQSPPK